MQQHYLKSSYREKLIEHLFIGELLKLSWASGSCNLPISKPEVDNQEYDLIAEKERCSELLRILKSLILIVGIPDLELHGKRRSI